MVQVAVKSFNTVGAPAAVEADFVKELQIAQLASATCQRVCHLIGCCKLDGKVCLVMSLYASSAASLLSDSKGNVSCKLAVLTHMSSACVVLLAASD